MKSFTQILTENSLYTDQATKDAFLANDTAVANAFVFNFLGYLGMINRTDNPKVFAHLKKDKKIRLSAITDENLDISLIVKHVFDKKWFIGSTTPNEITKLLFKLKNGDVKHIDDTIVHTWLDDLKPEFLQKLDLRIRAIYTEFRDTHNRKPLGWLCDPLKKIANRYAESGEFKEIIKQFSLNWSRMKPKVAPPTGVTVDTSGKGVHASPSSLPVSTSIVSPVTQVVVTDPISQAAPASSNSQSHVDDAVAQTQAILDAARKKAEDEEAERQRIIAEVEARKQADLLSLFPTDDEYRSFLRQPISDPDKVRSRVAQIRRKYGGNEFSKQTQEFKNAYYRMAISDIVVYLPRDDAYKSRSSEVNSSEALIPGLWDFIIATLKSDISSNSITKEEIVTIGSAIASTDYSGSYGELRKSLALEIFAWIRDNFEEFAKNLSSLFSNSSMWFFRDNVISRFGDRYKAINSEVSPKVISDSDYESMTNLIAYNKLTAIVSGLFDMMFHSKTLDSPLVEYFAGTIADYMDISGNKVFKNDRFNEAARVTGLKKSDVSNLKDVAKKIGERLYRVTGLKYELGRKIFRPFLGDGPDLPLESKAFFAALIPLIIDEICILSKDTGNSHVIHAINGLSNPMGSTGVQLISLAEHLDAYDGKFKECTDLSKGYQARFSAEIAEINKVKSYKLSDDPDLKDLSAYMASAAGIPAGTKIGGTSNMLFFVTRAMSITGAGVEDQVQAQINVLVEATRLLATNQTSDHVEPLSLGHITVMWPGLEIKNMTLAQKKEVMSKVINNPAFAKLFEQWKAVYFKGAGNQYIRQEYISAIQELIGDIIDSDPKLVNDFFANINDNYTEYKLREALSGREILSDVVMGGEIQPFDTLNEERLKEILRYNNVSYGDILQASGIDIKKKVREPLGDFLKRIKDAVKAQKASVQNSSGGLKPLEVTGVKRTPKELGSITEQLHATHSKGLHGNVWMKVLKEFDVHLPHDAFDAYRQENIANQKLNLNRSIKPAFHGTGGIAASMILRYGFTVISSNDGSVTGRMLGDGIYFSDILDKTLQYVGNSGYGRRLGTKGYIFQMDNTLGPQSYSRVAGDPGYAERLGGSHGIVSNEWCVREPEKQLKIMKCYEIEIIDRGAYGDFISKAKTLTEEKSLRSFSEFLAEDENDAAITPIANQTSFTFWDGRFPVRDSNGNWQIHDWDWNNPIELPGATVEDTANGPSVVFEDSGVDELFDIRWGSQMSQSEFARYSALWDRNP